MNKGSVLLDTCFLINLQNEHCLHHKQAKEYYAYFLENQISMYVSTISIAEYSVKGSYVDELPVSNFKITPFTISHSFSAGPFAALALENRKKVEMESGYNRTVITNDVKLLAQANVESHIKYFVTADANITKTFEAIFQSEQIANFKIININIPTSQIFPDEKKPSIEIPAEIAAQIPVIPHNDLFSESNIY